MSATISILAGESNEIVPVCVYVFSGFIEGWTSVSVIKVVAGEVTELDGIVGAEASPCPFTGWVGS